jgi:3-methyladenine DNA glycosylase
MATSVPFKTVLARAEKRKGGPKALEKLLPAKPNKKALEKLADDRILAAMTKRVFSAGFAWSVIENKWPGFEKAFLGFRPPKLIFQPDDYWHGLLSDSSIVRNGAKISSVRDNARFVQEISKEHGSFGRFLAAWPSSDEIGLLNLLSDAAAGSAAIPDSCSCASSAGTVSSPRRMWSPACARPGSISPQK